MQLYDLLMLFNNTAETDDLQKYNDST
jgi:hypothetical protein